MMSMASERYCCASVSGTGEGVTVEAGTGVGVEVASASGVSAGPLQAHKINIQPHTAKYFIFKLHP